jgi:hypothetical protein
MAGVPLGSSDPLWGAGGGAGRVSYQQWNPADAADSRFTLAHEVAHNLGRRHTNKGACGDRDSGTDWPYDDNNIQELGWDVALNQVVPVSKNDVLTYCSPPASNIWISPHTYQKLFDANSAPQARLSPLSNPMTHAIISGTAQADGSAGTLDPAYVIESDVAPTPSNPLGNYCLHTSGGAEIDYCFTLTFEDHRTLEPLAFEAFSVMIPLPPGTNRIALMKGPLELAAIEASASAPSLDITSPSNGDNWNGEQVVTWSASDGDGDPLTYAAMYSPDGGDTWYPLQVDSANPEFTIDTTELEAGTNVLFRVLASDGLNTTEDTVGPITIASPHIWGDVDCGGTINIGDAINVARFTIGLVLQAPQGCPTLGQDAGGDLWGDVDCGGAVNIGDAINIARFTIGIVLPAPGGCRTIGQ